MSQFPMSRPVVTRFSESHRQALRIQRRGAERHRVSGRVTALSRAPGVADHPDETRGRICPLQLLNISDSGVAALAQEAVEIGSHVTIFFPPHGPERGFDAVGRVVRCRPCQHGHEVGIHFDAKPAA